MASVEEHADGRVFQRCSKVAHFPIEARLVEIEAVDHLVAEPLQSGGHISRVVLWVGELRRVLISRIADDKRNSLLRTRLTCPRCHKEQAGNSQTNMAHTS